MSVQVHDRHEVHVDISGEDTLRATLSYREATHVTVSIVGVGGAREATVFIRVAVEDFVAWSKLVAE